jgi:hypothetical protein
VQCKQSAAVRETTARQFSFPQPLPEKLRLFWEPRNSQVMEFLHRFTLKSVRPNPSLDFCLAKSLANIC